MRYVFPESVVQQPAGEIHIAQYVVTGARGIITATRAIGLAMKSAKPGQKSKTVTIGDEKITVALRSNALR